MILALGVQTQKLNTSVQHTKVSPKQEAKDATLLLVMEMLETWLSLQAVMVSIVDFVDDDHRHRCRRFRVVQIKVGFRQAVESCSQSD